MEEFEIHRLEDIDEKKERYGTLTMKSLTEPLSEEEKKELKKLEEELEIK